MATLTDFLTGQNIASGYNIGGQSFISEVIVDFSSTNAATSDVVQVLNIPANAFVKNVWVECLTAEGATATVNVGDGSDVDGWDATVNVNSVAKIIQGDGAYAGGKVYTAADTIDIIPTADLDTAVIRVVAEYVILEVTV